MAPKSQAALSKRKPGQTAPPKDSVTSDIESLIFDEDGCNRMKEFTKSPTNAIIKLHPKSDCGAAWRVAGCLRTRKQPAKTFIVVIFPTDGAAQFAATTAGTYIKDFIPSLIKPFCEDVNIPKLAHKIVFVSATEVLRTEELLKHASFIIIDEFHYSSCDHELALAKVRAMLSSQSLAKNVKIILMSSYADLEDAKELLPNAQIMDNLHFEAPDFQADTVVTFGDDMHSDIDSYVEYVTGVLSSGDVALELRGHADDRGRVPVLIFAPSTGALEEIAKVLNTRNIVFEIRNLEECTEPVLFREGPTPKVIISLNYFHTRRVQADLLYKHVVCPHWIAKMWFRENIGRELPTKVNLTKPELQFLCAHGTTAWIGCAQTQYDKFSEVSLPVVLETGGIEYYTKAHYLFPGCTPFEQSSKPLPLRFFHSENLIAWAVHQMCVFRLADNVTEGVGPLVISDLRGMYVVRMMLDLRIELQWALVLENLKEMVLMTMSMDHKGALRSLLETVLPLALQTTFPGSPGLYRIDKDVDPTTRLNKLHSMCPAIPKDEFYNNTEVADAWLESKVLCHFKDTNNRPQTAPHWTLRLPDLVVLKARLDYALSCIKGPADLGDPWAELQLEPLWDKKYIWPPNPQIPAPCTVDMDTEADSVKNLFKICMYGARFFNLAYIPTDSEPGPDGKYYNAVDIASGRAVRISSSSTISFEVKEDVENGLCWLSYDSMAAVDDFSDELLQPEEFVIMGIIPLEDYILCNVYKTLHHNLQDWRSKDNIRQWIAYPFEIDGK